MDNWYNLSRNFPIFNIRCKEIKVYNSYIKTAINNYYTDIILNDENKKRMFVERC